MKNGGWRGPVLGRTNPRVRGRWGRVSDSTLEPDTGRRVPRDGARALSKATQGRAKTGFWLPPLGHLPPPTPQMAPNTTSLSDFGK